MSLDQAKAFVTGLNDLSDQFKADAKARTDEFTEATEGVAQEFVDASHSYAKDMVDKANKYLTDIQALYVQVYPEGAPIIGSGGDGGTTPPPEGELVDPGYGIDEEAGYTPPGGGGGTPPPEGGGNPPDWNQVGGEFPSTGPVGPQPKGKKK